MSRVSTLLGLSVIPALVAAAAPFGVSVRARVLAPVEIPAAVRASDALLGRVLAVKEPTVLPSPSAAPAAPATPAPPDAALERAPGRELPTTTMPPERRVRRPVTPEVRVPAAATAVEGAGTRHVDPRTMPAEPLHRRHPVVPPAGAGSAPAGPGAVPGGRSGEPGAGPGDAGHPRRDGPGDGPDRGGHHRDGDGPPRPQPIRRGPDGA